jgi:acetylornithine deacetylase/succinyl-diaminopimelate desuccinylase-like protein
MIEINPTRLLATLEALRNVGSCGTGVHRPALTPADLEARLWLRARLAELGFDARLDRFGTVLGRAPGDAPAILIGSHTDTVPQGGWLDGALGVAYALEIATARVDALGATAARVDVVSFQDEEGTFVPLLGSRAFIGEIMDAEPFSDAPGLPMTVERTAAIHATAMTPRIVHAFETSAAAAGAGFMRLASGAGHDAMILARRVPAGMLFVPSIGGRSHHVSEDTRAEDIIIGAQVMVGAVELLLAA